MERVKEGRHIAWISAQYMISGQEDKWLRGYVPGAGMRHRDKILINDVSAAWQVGQLVNLYAIHISEIDSKGNTTATTVVPIPESDFDKAPATSKCAIRTKATTGDPKI